jgi:hypothetical protein
VKLIAPGTTPNTVVPNNRHFEKGLEVLVFPVGQGGVGSQMALSLAEAESLKARHAPPDVL